MLLLSPSSPLLRRPCHLPTGAQEIELNTHMEREDARVAVSRRGYPMPDTALHRCRRRSTGPTRREQTGRRPSQPREKTARPPGVLPHLQTPKRCKSDATSADERCQPTWSGGPLHRTVEAPRWRRIAAALLGFGQRRRHGMRSGHEAKRRPPTPPGPRGTPREPKGRGSASPTSSLVWAGANWLWLGPLGWSHLCTFVHPGRVLADARLQGGKPLPLVHRAGRLNNDVTGRARKVHNCTGRGA